MTLREEKLKDIGQICNILLEQLSGHPQTDSTPEGRMISQLKWLKEKAASGTIDIPVESAYLSTLSHIYTEGNLSRLARSKADYFNRFEVPLYKLLNVTKRGELLLKPEFFPYAERCVVKLKSVIERAVRPLSTFEVGLPAELDELRKGLSDGSIEPPLIDWEGYPNFRKVFRINRSSVDDLPEGREVCRLVADLVFEGVRPESWVTEGAADNETASYIA